MLQLIKSPIATKFSGLNISLASGVYPPENPPIILSLTNSPALGEGNVKATNRLLEADNLAVRNVTQQLSHSSLPSEAETRQFFQQLIESSYDQWKGVGFLKEQLLKAVQHNVFQVVKWGKKEVSLVLKP